MESELFNVYLVISHLSYHPLLHFTIFTPPYFSIPCQLSEAASELTLPETLDGEEIGEGEDSDSEQEEDGIYCVYVLYSLSWVQ